MRTNAAFIRFPKISVVFNYWDKNRDFCPTFLAYLTDISYLCTGSINKKCYYG